MTSEFDRSCPPWCREPAGHLVVEPAGPGDYHLSEPTLIDLPDLPGLRGTTTIEVAIEQYVTAATTYQPVISLGRGEHGDSEALTLDEAAAVAAALTRAVTTTRDAQPRQPRADDASA